MRLFIAVELPAALSRQIAADAQALRGRFPEGRFSAPRQYHLTLAFLGEVAQSRLADVTGAMDLCRAAPCELTVGALGQFSGGVLWRAVDAPEALYRAQRLLTAALAGRGFAMEQRGYKPHLTLARQTKPAPAALLARLSPPPLRFTADHMTLFRSDRADGRTVYTPLHRTAWEEA